MLILLILLLVQGTTHSHTRTGNSNISSWWRGAAPTLEQGRHVLGPAGCVRVRCGPPLV